MTVPSLGATFDSSDVLWYVVAAIAAGFALAVVASVRRFVRWCGRRVKAGFLDWFQEAIDEHVEPKFARVREETIAAASEVKENSQLAAATIKQEALDNAQAVRDEVAATATAVKEELRIHTQEEGALVKRIVDQAVAPIANVLDTRTAMFERLEQTLTDTQVVLSDHMSHDEQMVAAASTALEAGQQALLTQLSEQHQETQERIASIEAILAQE